MLVGPRLPPEALWGAGLALCWLSVTCLPGRRGRVCSSDGCLFPQCLIQCGTCGGVDLQLPKLFLLGGRGLWESATQ